MGEILYEKSLPGAARTECAPRHPWLTRHKKSGDNTNAKWRGGLMNMQAEGRRGGAFQIFGFSFLILILILLLIRMQEGDEIRIKIRIKRGTQKS